MSHAKKSASAIYSLFALCLYYIRTQLNSKKSSPSIQSLRHFRRNLLVLGLSPSTWIAADQPTNIILLAGWKTVRNELLDKVCFMAIPANDLEKKKKKGLLFHWTFSLSPKTHPLSSAAIILRIVIVCASYYIILLLPGEHGLL